ncbi:MAG TPA: hypothetical protein VF212_00945 [Longimicrobiales bacterium]
MPIEFKPDGHGGMRARVVGELKTSFADLYREEEEAEAGVRYGGMGLSLGYVGSMSLAEAREHVRQEEEAARARLFGPVRAESNEIDGPMVVHTPDPTPGEETSESLTTSAEEGRLLAGKFRTVEELAEAYEELIAEAKAKGIEI